MMKMNYHIDYMLKIKEILVKSKECSNLFQEIDKEVNQEQEIEVTISNFQINLIINRNMNKSMKMNFEPEYDTTKINHLKQMRL